jgi:hypothetical protein
LMMAKRWEEGVVIFFMNFNHGKFGACEKNQIITLRAARRLVAT